MMRVQPLDRPFRDPLEEASDAQIRDDEHHRKQEHDRGEVDRLKRLLRSDNAKGHHQHRADDRGAGTVDLHPRKLAEREDEIAAEENQVGGEDPCL